LLQLALLKTPVNIAPASCGRPGFFVSTSKRWGRNYEKDHDRRGMLFGLTSKHAVRLDLESLERLANAAAQLNFGWLISP
jgi:hypothetical protein